MKWMTPRLYQWVTHLAVPLAKLYLRKRAKKQPAYLEHWDERFAQIAYPAPHKKRLWVHAVSVGETNAAAPLIAKLFEQLGDIELLLTCMTPTGRDAGRKIVDRYPGRVVQCYLPYDVTSYVEKFLDETRPTLAILMETEVWPNLIAATAQRRIPLVLANARESQKSSEKAESFDKVMRPAFSSFNAVLAQSKADAQRLIERGAIKEHVAICGSLKFDIAPNHTAQKLAQQFKACRLRPILLIASTRETEEALFAPFLRELSQQAIVCLVPRHPQRFEDVARVLEQAKVPFVRRSSYKTPLDIPSDVSVILGDSMGEMAFYCHTADVCIMGGSYAGTGCQNLIEPAAAGAPVILGPSLYNFARIAQDAIDMGAAVKTQNAQQAVIEAIRLIKDSALRQKRHEAALQFAQRYTGAADIMAQAVVQLWNKKIEK